MGYHYILHNLHFVKYNLHFEMKPASVSIILCTEFVMNNMHNVPNIKTLEK